MVCILRRKAFGDQRNSQVVVRVERSKNYRGRGVTRSRAYARRDTPENQRQRIYGVSQRKEQRVNLPKVGKHEVQVSEPRVLV